MRHVLVGGVHAVEDFAAEVAEAEGGETLSAHQTTKIIGEVLSELDASEPQLVGVVDPHNLVV